MEISERAFSGDADLQPMAELVHKFPAENLHVVNLPYRFSSWSIDYPENTRLWTDKSGNLLAWAMLQVPFWTIDYAYNPEFHEPLHLQILRWADEQAHKIVGTPSGHPAWYVSVTTSQTDRIRDLEQMSFESQESVGENSWSQVLMKHSMQRPAEARLPENFQTRLLNGASEIEAYVNLHQSVFESKNVTVEWRSRTLEHPEYIPELDLVTVAPDGQLAAFCVCWIAKGLNGEISGQIEPLGVHADFQKIGLGGAILLESLKRLNALGARRAYVQTDSHRNAAFRLYEGAGFQIKQTILMYRKDY